MLFELKDNRGLCGQYTNKKPSYKDHVIHFANAHCYIPQNLWKIPGLHSQLEEIEANPEKIKALIDLRFPQKSKEVQNLIERLQNFIASSQKLQINVSHSILKGMKKFQWTTKCEESIQALKRNLR